MSKILGLKGYKLSDDQIAKISCGSCNKDGACSYWDDCKISHEVPQVIDETIDWLNVGGYG